MERQLPDDPELSLSGPGQNVSRLCRAYEAFSVRLSVKPLGCASCRWRGGLSYDLQVWSTTRPTLPNSLPPEAWSESGSGWTHGVRGWQLTIQEPVAIEMEDMPRQVVDRWLG